MWRVRGGAYGSGAILVEWAALDMSREEAIERACSWGVENGYAIIINETWL